MELDPEHAFCLHGLQGSQTSIRIPDDVPVVVVVAVVVTVVDVVVVVDVDVVVAVGVVPIVIHYVFVQVIFCHLQWLGMILHCLVVEALGVEGTKKHTEIFQNELA